MWTDKERADVHRREVDRTWLRGISLTTPSEILSEIGSSLPTFSAGLEMERLDDCRNWRFV
jgi:hypothetical protein